MVAAWLTSHRESGNACSRRATYTPVVAVPLNSLKENPTPRGAVPDGRGGEDGERAAFLRLAGAGEDATGLFHRAGVKPAGHRAASRADVIVERSRQPGDRV